MFPIVPGWVYLLGASLALGMLHGVIRGEHTWPITFSYSVGSATGRGGIIPGILFVLAVTLQRSFTPKLVYLGQASSFEFAVGLIAPVYVAVGIAMTIAGYLIIAVE